MNKIFKVIWSKSKQCYVVVSEMAKNKTGKKKIVVASILAALAMQVGVVADVTAADRPTGTIEGGTKMYSNLTNGLAIGNESQSNSNQSIAIGYRAIANSQYADPAQPAVAIGAGAHATGRGGVSLGLIANSSVRGTAIGSATQATGFGAFAGGTYAQATNAGDVAIGGASSDRFDDYAVASGGYSVAIGTAAKADGGAGVSIGYKTNAKTSNSLAVGSESQATGEGAVAVGRKNTSTGASSTVLGILSTASATSATAVGMQTTATGENSLAVGHLSSAIGKNGVAVGTNRTTAALGGVAVGQAAKSNKFNSVAMGMNVTADGDNSVALGGSASANSDGTIAIGSYGSTPTKATGNKALAIGAATTANGLESIAIGSRVNSTSQHSIAIGTGANASAVKSVAIGPDSSVTVDGGVALGRDSVANVIGGVTNKGYNPNTNRTDIYSGLTGNVLTSTTGAVSIGNGTTVTRQLTGLAAGTKDTDAVNVAQLKSVNLAFSGNVNTGNVNIANSTLGLKGDNTYITTSANGQNLTISGKTQNIDVTNGQASANATGMADSKNVADAINKAISANAYHWKLAAENTSTAPEVINKSDTVIFGGDNNITVTRSGKKITTSLNKAITVDTVKANKSVTVSSGGNQITLDGSNGAVTGRSFTGDSFKAGNNVLSNTTLQMGLPSSAKNVTISGDGLTAKNGTRTVKFGTDGISAGGQQITNVSSGGNVGTNAANITDVKNAVDAVTLKLDTNSKTGTVKLSESPLKVIGANGIRTDLLGTNNGSLVVGLDKNTVNATTKGIGLTGDTGSTGLKYLKDGDATFKVAGDGDLVTTKASATGVQVAVDSGKVKDLAVGAVTVSKANTADNPITITPTAGTNTKDYAIGIDTTKLANQTQLTYKANGTNANKVFLANGLNFTDGTFTKATVGTNGNVTISTATETITNDADGKAKVNSPTDGLATAKNVADSINKAVDGLSQNLTVSDGATDGTVNLKNQKLTVSGTNGVTTTVNGQTVTVGLDAATKTKVDNASTAVARNISLGADSGTASSQSLKDGDVAFNVKAAIGDLVSTKMNGNTVEISTKRAAITSDANTGAASVIGDDGLATSKNVADAINKAADAAKAGAAWNLTTNSSTTDKTTVQGGDTVDLINGDNILITQDGTDKKKITVATKKDLTVDSITAGNTVMNTSGLTNGTTAITGTGITTDKVTVGGISIDKTDGINGGNKTITNVASGGTTDSNAANIGDVKQAVANLSQNLNITDGTNNGTIDLKNQKLNVAGANGVTATVNGQTVTVGLDADTKTKVDNSSDAVARNISLGADSGTASSQSLKDGDVAFNVKGATGDFISTKMNGDTVEVSTKRSTINSDAAGTASVTGDDGLATAKNVADAINKAASQAKDGAAWKLSVNNGTPTTVAGGDTVDFTGDNNITVTQTGKNIATTLNKDLKKLNSISLENGVGETIKFDAINASGKFGDPAVGNYTQIDRDGIRINNGIDVNQPNTANTYLDVGTLSLQAGPNSSSLDSKNLMFNDEDGNFAQGSAQGMAFRNAAGKEVQFTLDEINAGGNKIKEVAEGTDDTDAVNVKQLKDTVASQTLTYRANSAADTDAKSVKLSKGLDFVDGTMTKATVDNDGKVTFDINDDTKTKINDATAAVSRKVSLGADSGTTSSQSLKDGDVAFNVKGATGDFISTKMNGDTVEVSTKRATIDSDAAGTASVTGDDGLATAKNVADAINKAASQAKDGAAWKLSANGDTPTTVAGGDTVDFTGDNNITTDRDDKKISVKLNKNLTDLSSISLTNPRGETISLDGSTGIIKAYRAEFKDNVGAGSSIDSDQLRFTNGATGANGAETALSLDILAMHSGSNDNNLTSRYLAFNDANGNESVHSAQGLIAESAGGAKTIQFTLDEINAGGNKIQEVAEGTADTDAVNVKQLKDTVASQTLTYRANTAADADAKTVKLSKGLDFVDGTMTKATVDNDGKVTFDINDDTKTKINDSTAAVNRKVSLGADSGTVSSQSLKDGDVAFNVKGATGDFISTKMNGDTVEVSTKRATIDSNATTGAASVTGDDGLATAKNVADAINKAAKASTDAVNLKFSGDTNTSAGVVNLKDDTFGIKGDGKYVTTDADGKNLTVKVSEEEVKKSAVGAVTVSTDTTDANNPLTVTGTTSADGTTKDYKVTIDGTKVAAKTNLSYKANDGTAKQVSLADGLNFKNGNMTTASIDDAGVVKYDVNTETITAGADGTITGPATDGVATAKNVADAINAAKKSSKTEITANDGEAADGTTGNVVLTSSKAADGHTIYDVKLNDKVTLGTGANAVTLDGTTGAITGKTATIGGVTVDGTNKYVTGLGNTTWNGTATTGRAATEDQLKTVADAAKASTDAVNLKFSGDTNTSAGVVNLKEDTFGIKGDGKYVTTDADGKNLTVKVSEEEVKKSAVGAVTVSTDTTDANNPLTVTGTTSADGTTKDYKVTIDGTKVAAKTNLSYKANDGTAKQVSLADGLNFKNGNMTTASIDDAGVVKYDVNTETITAGADGTITGPATDGVATAKNVADAINAAKKSSKTEITANDGEAADGTTGNVVLTSSKAADGHTIYDVKLNDKVTLGTGANAVTLDGTTGAITGKTATIGGVTVDGTNKYVTGLANTTWDGNAVSGRAATEDQLKAVADAAASQTWQITADKDAATSGIQTGTKKDAKVGKDAKVKMIAGENITINQNELDFTYSLNKDLVNMNSASFNGTGGNTTVINGDSITQTAGTQTNTSTAAGNTVVDGAKSTATTAAGTTITDGTKTNTSTADSTVIDDGNGNNTALTKDGVTITTAGKDNVSLTGNGLDNGNNKIVNVADGTNDTDAVNVRQLEAKTKASTTELTANGGESAGSTTGNIVLTKKTAADGHIIYDNKLNDKVTLGTDPTKAVTVDGTNGTIKAGKDGNAVAINGTDGTIKAGDGTNAVAIDGKNGSVKAGDKIALDGKDGKATIGTVGIDGKDGVISGLANKTWDPNNITPGRAATEDQVKSAVADAGWDAAVGTEGSGVNSTPSATAEKVKPNETLTFKAGNNMMVSQNGKSISYAVNPELTDMKSATFKDAAGNTTVTNGNGMTITPGGTNPNNPNAGPVSLTKDGLNNGNNQLKGIAPGTDDTDAVNVGQLKASNAKIGDAIGQVAGEVQRVGAHAAAMAALKPIQYDPLEPTQVMAGIGNYRGETAAALGLAHYTNEDTMFNVGVSLGANRNMVNAGVTHKFGSSPEKKNIPDRYKAGPISSVYVMQDEVSSLKKENSEQKTVIADQAARLNTLEAENERQRQELAETKQGLEDLRAAVNQLLASKG